MKRNHLLALLMLLLVPFPAPGAEPPAPDRWALVGVTVVDPGRDLVQPETTVLVEGERIAAIFRDGTQPLPPGTRVQAAHGRYVIPGLIEGHTHLTPVYAAGLEAALHAEMERMLRGGVVAVRDMAGDARILAMARRRIMTGEIAGPDIHYSAVMGSPAFANADFRMVRSAHGHPPGSVPWAQAIDAGSDLRLAVARAAGSHAAALKLYAELGPKLIRTLTDEAHAQGLKVWAHATVYPNRPIEVVRAGVDVISHACGLAWQDRDLDPAAQKAISVDNRPRFDPALVQADSPEMQALFAEMVRRGTVLDATLTNHARPGDDAYGCTTELTLALSRAAVRAGVPLVAGTDYMAAPDDPQPSLLAELEYMVEHEVLDPAATLLSATLTAARVLGVERDLGTLETGKLASFVILEADPLHDIRALRRIETVIKRGRSYLPAAGGN